MGVRERRAGERGDGVFGVALGQGGAALAAAVAAPVWAAGALVRPRWREGAGERLGWRGDCEPGAIWLHGASVGEALMVARLAEALADSGHRVQASATTVTGRSALRRALPSLPVRLAPLDHPWCVASALRAARPSALVLVETELWPSWITAVSRRGAPVALVSARLSDTSFVRYQHLRGLVARTLGRIARIGARSDEDAQRFLALGAPRERVRVTGDLKRAPAARPASLAPDLAAMLAGPPIVVAGSTHAGEEAAALAALDACAAAGRPAALVLAPRRPERCRELESRLAAEGRPHRRRSRGDARPLAEGEVLLLDTLGELAGVYARARVAFVGGTLVPVGGHNLLEPAQQGCPVLFGPEIGNVRDAAGLLLGAGAGKRVRDARELAEGVTGWLTSDAGRVAARATAEVRARSESLGATLALLHEILPAPQRGRAPQRGEAPQRGSREPRPGAARQRTRAPQSGDGARAGAERRGPTASRGPDGTAPSRSVPPS